MEHLDEATVAALLDPREVTDILQRVFAELGRGEAATTVRVRAGVAGSMASAMAAVVPSMGVSGGKIYATKSGRFTFHVVLFDLDGRVICSLDGGALTEVRTPALCGVAVRNWAAPGSATAALLGTGVESVPHLEMLARELPVTDVRVWGRTPEKVEEVVAHGRARAIPARAASTAEDAVSAADVVVTVTSANDPLFDADALAESALVCAVGATKAERCELDPDVFSRAQAVIVDSLDGSRVECGDLIRAADAGTFDWSDAVELSDALCGASPVERAGHPGPVVFETQGVAIQDVAAGAHAWQRHRARAVK